MYCLSMLTKSRLRQFIYTMAFYQFYRDLSVVDYHADLRSENLTLRIQF